jgi:hypothetical protein
MSKPTSPLRTVINGSDFILIFSLTHPTQNTVALALEATGAFLATPGAQTTHDTTAVKINFHIREQSHKSADMAEYFFKNFIF